MPVPGLRSKGDFERMFEPSELDLSGDCWGHRWRGSQKLRHSICLEIVGEALGHSGRLEVLDIGCGQSDFLLRLREAYPHYHYHGTDISENAIAWNKEKYPFAEYHQAALPDVGYPPCSFDLICALEVLYYLEEEQRRLALESIAYALAPNGLLLLSGVLDGGQHYFAKDRILRSIKEVLSIERVEYNYARIYTLLEAYPLKLARRLRRVGELLALPGAQFERWAIGKHGLRTRLMILARGRAVRQAMQLGTNALSWLLKKALEWQWLPRVCSTLTRGFMSDKGRTHIVVVACKRTQASG